MTHHVEIRAKKPRAPWTRLNRSPLGAVAAQHLAHAVGTAWETRIVPGLESGDGELVEKLGNLVEIPAERWDRFRSGFYEEEDLVDTVREALFHLFESHGATWPFRRWKAGKHRIVHAKGCGSSRSEWTTKNVGIDADGAARGDLRWFVLSEIKRRCQHLNDIAIPSLGITATAEVRVAREHTGTCSACDATATASSAPVVITWGARELVREYVIS